MNARAGDIGFVDEHDWTAFFISFAQKRKYGKNNPAARWTHVFFVSDDFGSIIQANPTGVERGRLSEYRGMTYELKRPPYEPGRAADAVAAMTEQLGREYGFLTIASVALALMTGTKLRFGISGSEICSGSCADALTRANVDCGPDESFDTPSDLYALVGWTESSLHLADGS
jgi:hypothetical protein